MLGIRENRNFYDDSQNALKNLIIFEVQESREPPSDLTRALKGPTRNRRELLRRSPFVCERRLQHRVARFGSLEIGDNSHLAAGSCTLHHACGAREAHRLVVDESGGELGRGRRDRGVRVVLSESSDEVIYILERLVSSLTQMLFTMSTAGFLL